jgi:SAM-dependent methyltransferase
MAIQITLLIMTVLAICFSFVLLKGAPYLPTLKPQVKTAMDIADLEFGQTMLELGCGDGRVLMAAAERGWHVVGYELNPILAFISWTRTRKYGNRVKVIWGDYWKADWPESQAIFTFLLVPYMEKLNTKIEQYYGKYGKYKGKSTKLVSFAFQIPGIVPDAEKDGVFLYLYK